MKWNALVVGDAVISIAGKNLLSEYFQVTFMTDLEFKTNLKTSFVEFDLLWIHVETTLTLDKLELFSNQVVVATTSTGYTHLSLEVVKSLGNRLITLKSQSSLLEKITSTAEIGFMLILIGLTRVLRAIEDVQKGNWNRLANSREKQISSTTIGIIGFGRLGSMVANYAKAFGARVITWDIDPQKREKARLLGFEVAQDLKFLVQNSDAISIHVNANHNEIPVIDGNLLAVANDKIVIVNTSRGSVVDEESIANFLVRNPNSLYLTDVLHSEEKGQKLTDSVIWNTAMHLNRVVITPHIGGASRDAMELCELNILNRAIEFLEENRK